MNICIFTRSMPAHREEGAMFHHNIMGTGLVKRGHQVTVLTTSRKDGIENEEKEGMSIFYLKGAPSDVYTNQYWLESTMKFEELHQKKGFDIIVSESAGGFGCIKYKIISKYRTPFVAILHNTPPSVIRTTVSLGLVNTLSAIKNQLFFYMKILHKLYNLSDGIICVSEYMRKNLLLLPMIKNRDKIYVVYNGIDTNIFKPNVKPQKLKNDKTILYVGRVAKEKGIQFAIRSLPEIVKEVETIKLIVVGRGDYIDNLRSLAKRIGVEKYVLFTGGLRHSDLVNYYNIADVFVLPSIRESFPLVLLEAMACKRAIVASRTGGIPEIVEDGINGYLIPVGKIKQLAKKIIYLLKENGSRKKFGENGRKKVLEKFTLDKMLDDTEKVFKKIIKDFHS